MKSIIQFFLAATVWIAIPIAVPVYGEYSMLPGEEPSNAAALTPEILQSLETAVPMTPQMRAVRNALANSSLRSLTIDPDVENGGDALFTKVIADPGSIANQQQSGRCWLFAGLNALRPAVIAREKMKDFMLSQAYEQFYEELEAANRSLELAISLRGEPVHSRRLDTLLQNLISDGGNWNYVRALIEKYGAVPESVMPDDYAAAHTGDMAALLAVRLHKAVLEIRQPSHNGESVATLRQIKIAALQDIYKILELCLGKPPKTFAWRYETKDDKVSPLTTYTPQSFRRKFLQEDLSRYVSFANYPGQPMPAHLRWVWERNMADQPDFEAVNLDMQTITEMTRKSVMADQPVWFAADSAAEGDKAKGLWLADLQDKGDLFGMDFSISKADALAYDSGSPDHAMMITGVDIQNNHPVKWKIENSWGENPGNKGWFIMDQKWFEKHVYQVIIDRRFVDKAVLDVAKQPPILLPPWDPFSDWGQRP